MVQSLYGYVRLVVCTFGSVAKVCAAVELTGRNATSDPTNAVRIALGTVDIPKMLMEILTVHMRFPLIGQYLVSTCLISHSVHTSSVCLTLVLTAWGQFCIGT